MFIRNSEFRRKCPGYIFLAIRTSANHLWFQKSCKDSLLLSYIMNMIVAILKCYNCIKKMKLKIIVSIIKNIVFILNVTKNALLRIYIQNNTIIFSNKMNFRLSVKPNKAQACAFPDKGVFSATVALSLAFLFL